MRLTTQQRRRFFMTAVALATVLAIAIGFSRHDRGSRARAGGKATMNRPIIVFPEIMFSDDVMYFDSIEAAESYIEPPDIGETVIYDCEGVRLSAKVEHRKSSFWAILLLSPVVREVVVISEDVPRSQDADDLRLRIRQYLEWIGHPVDGDAPDSLDVLIPQVRKWARCG